MRRVIDPELTFGPEDSIKTSSPTHSAGPRVDDFPIFSFATRTRGDGA